jgi:hypothetical protein
MVSPIKISRRRLSDFEEEKLLSSIFADLLLQMGYSSNVEKFTIGEVNAKILASYSMFTMNLRNDNEKNFFVNDKNFTVYSEDKKIVLTDEDGSRMLLIGFSCSIGKFYVFANIRHYEKGFSIVSLNNSPAIWALFKFPRQNHVSELSKFWALDRPACYSRRIELYL